ncbi:hypothetical protein HYH03_019043 [Edaphochlamys debaryana]|uniref:Uncharacterized protein n=1 Tax=Edaphochlamys debaryana TaxID=47281 RepID=A0A836BMJ8_9CHLO|nr:hypothetical protein HYH03_019043 [Edaphochlamys debaryana]|eukprot:KAG2482005.1 hypothetical protein HYH03_019043 [Edaphochlamys debaryana]
MAASSRPERGVHSSSSPADGTSSSGGGGGCFGGGAGAPMAARTGLSQAGHGAGGGAAGSQAAGAPAGRSYPEVVAARHSLSRALAAARDPAGLTALLEAALTAPEPLIDSVCVSAAACRMARLLQGGRRQPHAPGLGSGPRSGHPDAHAPEGPSRAHLGRAWSHGDQHASAHPGLMRRRGSWSWSAAEAAAGPGPGSWAEAEAGWSRARAEAWASMGARGEGQAEGSAGPLGPSGPSAPRPARVTLTAGRAEALLPGPGAPGGLVVTGRPPPPGPLPGYSSDRDSGGEGRGGGARAAAGSGHSLALPQDSRSAAPGAWPLSAAGAVQSPWPGPAGQGPESAPEASHRFLALMAEAVRRCSPEPEPDSISDSGPGSIGRAGVTGRGPGAASTSGRAGPAPHLRTRGDRRPAAQASPWPPVRRFRPRELANTVWGLAAVRGEDAALAASAPAQAALLAAAGELLAAAAAEANGAVVAGAAGPEAAASGGESPPTARRSPFAAPERERSHGRGGAPSSRGGGEAAAWRPGELAMLGWGLARAGVVPPSRAWLLAYLGAWRGEALASAGPQELACLAWALAAWRRKAVRAEAWGRRPAVRRAPGGGGGGQGRGALAAGGALPLPAEWLEAFWAASGERLRGQGAGAAALGAGQGQGQGAARGWAAGEVAMLLWSVSELRLRPPDEWLQAALRAAAAAAPSANPLALATTLLGAARMGRVLPPPPPAGLPLPPAPELVVPRLATAAAAVAVAATVFEDADASCDEAAAELPAPAFQPPPSAALSPLHSAAALAAAGYPAPSAPASLVALASPPRRLPPRPPAPSGCRSLLAAFARGYLGRVGAGLEGFGPSQVVDCLVAIQALARWGHLPPASALPLPLPALLAALAARLQRCYAAGLGPRHLLAAAGAMAALVPLLQAPAAPEQQQHDPPPPSQHGPLPQQRSVHPNGARAGAVEAAATGADPSDGEGEGEVAWSGPSLEWVRWWLDEKYGRLRALRGHELTAVAQALAVFRVVPGPTWTAAFLAAALRRMPRMPRTALAHLAAAMAAAGLRLAPPAAAAAAGGNARQWTGAGAEAGPEEAAAWRWLERLLRLWLRRRGELPGPTAAQARRLRAALEALAGPASAWPPRPRALLARASALPREQRGRWSWSRERPGKLGQGQGCGSVRVRVRRSRAQAPGNGPAVC